MDGAIVKSAEKNRSEGDFDMLPGAFVYGGKKTDKLVVICDIVKKMCQRTNECNNDSGNYNF